MKTLMSLIRDKRILLVPNLDLSDHTYKLAENHNVLTWVPYKLIRLIEDNPKIKARSATFNPSHEYDVVLASYAGDKLDTDGCMLNSLKKEGKTIFEFYWCGLNAMFFLERVTIAGQSENLTFELKPSMVEEKKEVLNHKVF